MMVKIGNRNFVRIEDRKQGIRYISTDIEYRIWKPYKKAQWELSGINGHGHKVLKYFKYFKDAKQYLKDLLGE